MHKIVIKAQRKTCFLLLTMSLFLLAACQEVPVMNPNIPEAETVTLVPEPTTASTETQAPQPTTAPTETRAPQPTRTVAETPTPQPASEPEETVISEQAAEPTELPALEKSILGFLRTAVRPVGKTMYVWGGGWNEEDTAAGIEAVTLGVSPAWEEFAKKQDASYDYNTTRYQIHDGLDCSGYVGWAVYNVLETENGKEGYVLSSTKMAENFAERGLGEYLPMKTATYWRPGDIVSMKGHVWIAVGMCEDGSVLLLHASPPGVSFCGTKLADGSRSQAVALAEQVMQTYYPEWYANYPECSRPNSYLTESAVMRWSSEVLDDKEQLREMSAEEVIAVLFAE